MYEVGGVGKNRNQFFSTTERVDAGLRVSSVSCVYEVGGVDEWQPARDSGSFFKGS
jgi:hypothetical protein